MTTSQCRITALVARKANKAVIFRRGPSRHWQMLLWDFDNDVITPGQWVKSFSVHICSVSDDAQYVSIIGSDYRQPLAILKLRKWLALSHPPYFTAVGLWNLSPLSILSNPENKNNLKKFSLPDSALALARRSLNYNSRASFEEEGWMFEFPDAKSEDFFFRGYRSQSNLPVRRTKTVSGGEICIEITGRDWLWHEQFITSLIRKNPNGEDELVFSWSENNWIDVDNSGRLVYADKGCLYAWQNFPEGRPALIADLNPNIFESIPPPDWALKP